MWKRPPNIWMIWSLSTFDEIKWHSQEIDEKELHHLLGSIAMVQLHSSRLLMDHQYKGNRPNRKESNVTVDIYSFFIVGWMPQKRWILPQLQWDRAQCLPVHTGDTAVSLAPEMRLQPELSRVFAAQAFRKARRLSWPNRMVRRYHGSQGWR